SGLGTDFHADPQSVIWVTGAGCAIASGLGAIASGFLADRMDRGYLYVLVGIVGAGCALGMAFSPHTTGPFATGVLAYNWIAGMAYAACMALSLQLVGPSNPAASTVLGLLYASMNAAIVYMTWADGVGYRHFGAR